MVILSTRSFQRAETIDSGDTIVLRFRTAEGRDAAILIPREAAEEMLRSLDVELERPRR